MTPEAEQANFVKNFCMGIVACAVIAMVVGCTANTRAKEFGGSMSVNLDEGKRLVNVTWKESELWLLTRTTRVTNDPPSTYTLQEKSGLGWVEGRVTIIEQ